MRAQRNVKPSSVGPYEQLTVFYHAEIILRLYELSRYRYKYRYRYRL